MVTERIFGQLPTGEEVKIFHLENRSGAYAEASSDGAILVSLCVPTEKESPTDVVLGYDNIQEYQKNGCFFGACIGRNGNRIAGASFSLDGQEVVLSKNEGENNLHSGPDGFEKKLWDVQYIDQDDNSITFKRISPDGENGFPGEFNISVTYEFTVGKCDPYCIFWHQRQDDSCKYDQSFLL